MQLTCNILMPFSGFEAKADAFCGRRTSCGTNCMYATMCMSLSSYDINDNGDLHISFECFANPPFIVLFVQQS